MLQGTHVLTMEVGAALPPGKQGQVGILLRNMSAKLEGVRQVHGIQDQNVDACHTSPNSTSSNVGVFEDLSTSICH